MGTPRRECGLSGGSLGRLPVANRSSWKGDMSFDARRVDDGLVAKKTKGQVKVEVEVSKHARSLPPRIVRLSLSYWSYQVPSSKHRCWGQRRNVLEVRTSGFLIRNLRLFTFASTLAGLLLGDVGRYEIRRDLD